MRTKRVGGGRARLSSLPPQPSAKAISYLRQPCTSEAQPNNSCNGILVNEDKDGMVCSAVFKTMDDNDGDGQTHDLLPNTSADKVVLDAGKIGGLDPHDICGQKAQHDFSHEEILVTENDDTCYNTALEDTSDSNDDGQSHDLESAEKVDTAEKTCCLGPQGTCEQEAHPGCSRDNILTNEAKNDSACGTVPESFSGRPEEQCHEKCPDARQGRILIAEKSFGSGPHGISEQEDELEMDWTEKDSCIKCDKGGRVLVCSDSGCPIAVHEKCLPYSPRFDCMGKFYCSYCSYKQAMLKTRKARKKVVLAKKGLSLFLEKGPVNVGMQMQKAQGDKTRGPSPPMIVGEISHDDTGNRLNVDGLNVQLGQLEDGREGERLHPECTTSNPGPRVASGGGEGVCSRVEETGQQFEAVHAGKRVEGDDPRPVDGRQVERVVQDEQLAEPSIVHLEEVETRKEGAAHVSRKRNCSDRGPDEEEIGEQAQETTGSSSGEDLAEQGNGEAIPMVHSDAEAALSHGRCVRQKYQKEEGWDLEPSGRLSKRSSCEKNSTVEDKEKTPTSSKSRQQIFPNERRKKLLWKAEEEEILKEGVKKFSTTVTKNLPWRKVLEFGRHVFDSSRTPVDLKDKWRNMLAKESLKK